jgi:putative ABC transport system permease protein
MSRLREWSSRLSAFILRRRSHDGADLDEELQFHLAMAEEQLRRAGVDADEARRGARIQLGGLTQVAEAYREQRGLPIGETVLQDMRYAVRTLARTPGFTLAALVTLALGIGANTAIFSVVDTVLLRPLPYKDPGRLVMIGDRAPDGSASNVGYATFQDLRDRSRTVPEMAAIRSWNPTLVAEGEAERLSAMRVSWNYFAMLGAGPALGRGFTAAEDRPDQWRVLLLSDGLWRRRFGSDPGVVGRTVLMNDVPYRIVGVMPASFEPLVSARFYQPAELWAPLGYDTSLTSACRSCQHLKAVGRIGTDATASQARAELNAIRGQLAASYPSDYPPGDMAVVGLQDAIAGPVRSVLYVLLGAVGLVLLIACANVANLLLARAMNRSREMAVRSALGAGRARLVRQVLTESVTLSLAGGALGVALAGLLLGSVATLAPVSIPRLDHASIDPGVLGFALLLSVVTGVLFGLVPALRVSRESLQATLALDSRTSVGRPSHRTRGLLVVGDLALALVLLASAGSMVKSVVRLMGVNPGFNTDRVLTLQFSLIGTRYREDAAVVSFMDRALDRIKAIPGVEAAAAAGQVPLGGNGDTWGFHIEGRIKPNPSEDPAVERFSVTPDYFRVLGIPVLEGRLITGADRADSLPVIVISEATAKALWPGEDPIGRRVRIGDASSGPWRTIVGVAGDVRHTSLAAPPTLQMYLPQAQVTDSYLVLTVREGFPAASSLAPQIGAVFREMDPAVPIYSVATMEELAGKSVAERRFVMRVLGGFAALALLLAAVGLYGVVSYTVTQRTREVGVRMALGARPADILRLVLRSGAATVATGLAVGVTAALLAMQSMRALLFDVSAFDPATLAGSVAALSAVAIAAHIIPARRALRVDPVIALRQE